MNNTFTRQMDFWRSPRHEAFMLSNNYGDEHDYVPVAVKIDGLVIPYTACVGTGAAEPFENALKNFPDYVKVATGTLQGFQHRRKDPIQLTLELAIARLKAQIAEKELENES